MISILFAALCMGYDASGACVDRMVLPAGQWEGAAAPAECEAEVIATQDRLKQEGLERHFKIYCETTPGGE